MRKTFIRAAVLMLLAVWGVCAVRVNRRYPSAEILQAGLNEPLDCGTCTAVLTEAYLADTAALYAEYNLPVYGALPEKTLVCLVALEGTEEGLPPVALTSGAWHAVCSRDALYAALNPPAGAARQTYVLPFGLYREGFSAESWAALPEKTFALQFSLYPYRREAVFRARA